MEHDTEMGRLTNKIIENLPVQSKGYILWDGETKGFGIRININGKKLLFLKKNRHSTNHEGCGDLKGIY